MVKTPEPFLHHQSTQSEKQNISALTQLAAGLTTAALGGDAQDINTAMAGGKNAIENNYLSAPEDKELKDAEKKLYWIEQGKIKASEEEKQALINEIENKKLLDIIRNIDIENACQNILSSECITARQQLNSAFNSYFEKLQDGFMSYNDSYLGDYAKYYDGYKEIASLSNELASRETDASRELYAQKLAEYWGVSIETARVMAIAEKVYNTSMQLAANVVGPNSIKGNIAGKGTSATGQVANNLNIDELINFANKPVNVQGLSEAARAWEKHAGRQGGTFEPLKGNVNQKNAAASEFVKGILENPNTIKTELSRGGVEFRLPNGQGIRYNADGSFSGFLDPKKK